MIDLKAALYLVGLMAATASAAVDRGVFDTGVPMSQLLSVICGAFGGMFAAKDISGRAVELIAGLAMGFAVALLTAGYAEEATGMVRVGLSFAPFVTAVLGTQGSHLIRNPARLKDYVDGARSALGHKKG